jgi:hypothetical protein
MLLNVFILMKLLFTSTNTRNSFHRIRGRNKKDGFALISTISIMVLLLIMAVAMMNLSSITVRESSSTSALAQAQANARLSLMIAIGELQEEMGPDMRISAESAILDQDEDTEAIEGIAQSRWLSSYDSWGNWLNADYTRPAGGGSLSIQDTYTKGRKQLFRRWLLSLPEGAETNFDLPLTLAGLDTDRMVKMVGSGSLGDKASTHPDQVTKAYLFDIGENGRIAWWIGPENHRAKVTLSKNPRSLTTSEWETSQGDTAEVGVGALEGFDFLDTASWNSDRLITRGTLDPAGADSEAVKGHFFDLTTHSKGVIASVRSGHLKKDLSLLLEKSTSNLPDEYRYESGDTREPSIRPMSADLLGKNPKIPNRHFASWTNMRHYYRMYRQSSDANTGDIGSSGALQWAGTKPWSEAQVPLLYRDRNNSNQWMGDNSYTRMPVLAKLTFIYSLMTERVNPNSTTDLRYRLYLVYTPVLTYWNPYNVELRIPDNTMGCLSSTYQVLPMHWQLYLKNNVQGADPSGLFTGNAHSFLRSGTGGDIVFKPGEIKLFSHTTIKSQSGGQRDPLDLVAGFDPQAYGGDRRQLSVRNATDDPGIAITFGHSSWGGNVGYGNTAGSLCHTPFWLPQGQDRERAFNWNYPMMYQNDWFNLSQTYTPMSDDPEPIAGVASKPENILRWVFSDSDPVPVAYAQLVLKGLSEFDYESISWDKDWRGRNWLHSPPFYFGNSLYMSEDDDTAHTQRLDNPYAMNFGSMSAAEMPKVVGHTGERAFLGSGSNPYELVTATPALELPTAPVGSLASFSGMRINPGWANPLEMNSQLKMNSTGGHVRPLRSYYYALNKTVSYQSGVTGPGIGNSFVHPMIPRDDVYRYFNNSVSADPAHRGLPLDNISYNDNKVFSDFWDHVFLLNDSLWDDYFVSSLADQTRPGASDALSLDENLDRLLADTEGKISNSRYQHYQTGESSSNIKTELLDQDGYLKAARHLMVDGSFNVNSTSVDAWQALFFGIRERMLVYRDGSGELQEINVPAGKRIALSRLNTAITEQEMDDTSTGVLLADGRRAWSGVRFLDDAQLRKLAEECVKQVKLRGPFLTYSEFINRRLSDDILGTMGALQSAIDYDDDAPESDSINYLFKSDPAYMITEGDLGSHEYASAKAVEGSRLAGIPGYVIQSDVLKPLGNTLTVRDDTFRIRAYGETLNVKGEVVARAWCEAIVQRIPEYSDPNNGDHIAARTINALGNFVDNSTLTDVNRRFGRKFQIRSFRWLKKDEI